MFNAQLLDKEMWIAHLTVWSFQLVLVQPVVAKFTFSHARSVVLGNVGKNYPYQVIRKTENLQDHGLNMFTVLSDGVIPHTPPNQGM